jgi:hypothetical protein
MTISIIILTSPVHSNIWMTDIAFSAKTGIPDDLDVLSLSRIISIDSIFTVIYSHKIIESIDAWHRVLAGNLRFLPSSQPQYHSYLPYGVELYIIYTETQKQSNDDIAEKGY